MDFYKVVNQCATAQNEDTKVTEKCSDDKKEYTNPGISREKEEYLGVSGVCKPKDKSSLVAPASSTKF